MLRWEVMLCGVCVCVWALYSVFVCLAARDTIARGML